MISDPGPLPPGWRFPHGETRRLELSEGDWLVVRTRLTAGERRDALTRTYETAPDGSRLVNPALLGLATILAYVVDWSITSPAGPIPIRESFALDGRDRADVLAGALQQIAADSFDEILEAVRGHERDMAAAREAEKKTRAGAPASSPISGSPASMVGAMSGSATSTPRSTTSSSRIS